MGSDIYQQIEIMLLGLRHVDAGTRARALSSLSKVLSREDFEPFRDVILRAIKKYSLNDPDINIREAAKSILLKTRGAPPPARSKKKKVSLFRTVFVLTGVALLAVMIMYLLLPSAGGPGRKTRGASVARLEEDPQKYKFEYRVKKKFRDNVNIEIKNKVVFKDNHLFTNVMKFKMQRKIREVFASGTFVMQQQIVEGYGLTGDLHDSGYPNPGEKLKVTYSRHGRAKMVQVGRKRLPAETVSNFTKYVLSGTELTAGSYWSAKVGSSLVSDYRFVNIVHAGDLKLFQVLFRLEKPSYALTSNGLIKSETTGEVYLDFDTMLPLVVKTQSTFLRRSGNSSLSLKSIITITETSTKLDKLQLKGLLDNFSGSGAFRLSDRNAKDQVRGVTD